MNIPPKSVKVLDYASMELPTKLAVKHPSVPYDVKFNAAKTLRNSSDILTMRFCAEVLADVKSRPFSESPIGKLLMKVFRK